MATYVVLCTALDPPRTIQSTTPMQQRETAFPTHLSGASPGLMARMPGNVWPCIRRPKNTSIQLRNSNKTKTPITLVRCDFLSCILLGHECLAHRRGPPQPHHVRPLGAPSKPHREPQHSTQAPQAIYYDKHAHVQQAGSMLTSMTQAVCFSTNKNVFVM